MSSPKTAKSRSRRHSADEYSFSVMWSESDGVFIGRVAEFPSLAAHGSTAEKALREIRNAVKFVIEDLEAGREPVPTPIGKKSYSGKLNVRMSRELHRRLALESQREGVSLNNWINTKLSR